MKLVDHRRSHCMRSGDPFGEMLRDALHDKISLGVVERSDGYLIIDSADRYFAPYEQWPEYEQQVICSAKGRVIDLGCGAGRHALYLQGQRLQVIGIDNSQ